MRCGATFNLERTKHIVTTRQKICRITKPSFRNWTPGPISSPASSKRKGKSNQKNIERLATNRRVIFLPMCGWRGATFVCASEVHAYFLHQRSNNDSG